MLPVLLDLPFFTLYAYPLFMGLAWGVGFYLTEAILTKYNVATKDLLKLYTGLFVSTWVGAKVFFLIFSSKNHFYRHLNSESFWLGGGFVFYGGLIAGLLFYLIYSWWLKKFPFQLTGFLAPGLAFGHAIGRVGCFLAGCCFGKQCDLPWAVSVHGTYVHPVQLYEAFGLIIIGLFMLKCIKMTFNAHSILGIYLLCYALLRFAIEFYRGDSVRGIFFNMLSTSQFISIGVFTFGLLTLLSKRLKK